MYIDKLKEKVCAYQKFINENKNVKDKALLDFAEEVWRVKVLIKMYEEGGEKMSFDIKAKAQKLDNMYNDIVDELESGL